MIKKLAISTAALFLISLALTPELSAGRGQARTNAVARSVGTTPSAPKVEKVVQKEPEHDSNMVFMTKEGLDEIKSTVAKLQAKAAFPQITHFVVGGLGLLGGVAAWYFLGPKVEPKIKQLISGS